MDVFELYLTKLFIWQHNQISKRCRCYKECTYSKETDTFTSTVTGETFKINHPFDCNDKCLVYLMTCNNNKCKQTIHLPNYRSLS